MITHYMIKRERIDSQASRVQQTEPILLLSTHTKEQSTKCSSKLHPHVISIVHIRLLVSVVVVEILAVNC